MLNHLWTAEGLKVKDAQLKDEIKGLAVRLRQPGAIRVLADGNLGNLALELSTMDKVELRTNPEYQPQSETMWIELTEMPNAPHLIAAEKELCNERGVDPKSLAVSVGLALDGQRLFSLWYYANGECALDCYNMADGEEAPTGLVGLAAGFVRLFNIQETKDVLDRETFYERPPGRRFNGMPFSPIEFSKISLRAYERTGDLHTATDRHGVRLHLVRGHYMFAPTKGEKVWRRSHWRGDANKGTTRAVHSP